MEPKSLIQIISEEEFLILLQDSCGSFFRTFNAFETFAGEDREVTRKCYSSLTQVAELLESFLDEHGARENRTWAKFTEYVASIRNLVKACFYCRHMLDRYPFYRLREEDGFQELFFKDAGLALNFLNQSILNLYRKCIEEGRANGLQVTEQAINPDEFLEMEANKRLPKNAVDEEVKEEGERIIDLLQKMNSASNMMSAMNISPTKNEVELKSQVPARIDEKKARMLMNLIHSIQSEFDTYIKSTPIEQKHEGLKQIRGYISVPLHLLEMMNWMIHFYERHEDEIRKGEAKSIISELVNKVELLSHIINFSFHYCHLHVIKGDELSREILKSFVKHVRYEVAVPDPLGFHARPSTYVSLIVRKYGGEAWLLVDDERFDAKSVMSLLQAGGAVADKGYKTVVFEGDKRVLDDIRILASHNYCEEASIPSELDYLRNDSDSKK